MPFSVLMSLYAKERPDFLRQSLDSIFNQTLKPSEVIMVEDGPLTDDLYAVLDETEKFHPELKRIKLPKNGGLGAALNQGLKHCSHELVARMDTDDICFPNRFEKQMQIFKSFPQVEVVSAWIKEFDTDSFNDIAIRKIPEFPFEIYKYGKKRCPINHPVVMFKKRAIEFAGGYLPFPLFEDYYLWVRLLLNGAKFYNVQEPLLRFRISSDLYKRRGGWKHAVDEIRFQRHIHKLGFTSRMQLVINVIIRFATRICPNSLRAWIYHNLLR